MITELMEATTKSRKKTIANLKFAIILEELNPMVTKKSENPNPPAINNFVTLTGSVTVSVNRKSVVRGAPISISDAVVFSATVLNICES